MLITDVTIQSIRTSGFASVANDGVQHIKVLPYLSIVQSLEGSYDIALGGGKTEQTGEGGFFIAPSGVQQTIVHHVNPASGHMTCRWVFLDVIVNGVHKLDTVYRFPTIIRDAEKEELNRLFDRLFAADNVWDTYSCCYQMLGFLTAGATRIARGDNPGIRDAVAYINDHYMQPISIGELAGIAHISESYFYAAFRSSIGTSPIAYLNHRRMSVAADRLIDTDDPVGVIGSSVGIQDPVYFHKLFRKTFDMTPRAYRLMYRAR